MKFRVADRFFLLLIRIIDLIQDSILKNYAVFAFIIIIFYHR